jgi:hypothetical protein
MPTILSGLRATIGNRSDVGSLMPSIEQQLIGVKDH